MNEHKDDSLDSKKDLWVDELLGQVPAPREVPQFVSRDLDAFLAQQVAALEKESAVTSLTARRSRRNTGFYLSVGLVAAAVIGVFTFAGNNFNLLGSDNGVTEISVAAPSQSANSGGTSTPESNEQSSTNSTPETSQATSEPTAEPEKTPESGANSGGQSNAVEPESTEIQVLGSQGGTKYLPSDAPNIMITRTGMDYATSLNAVVEKTLPFGEPGKVNKLPAAELQCIVKLDLVDRVIAVDYGRYNGKKAVAYFVINDDGTTDAVIAYQDGSCSLAKRTSIN